MKTLLLLALSAVSALGVAGDGPGAPLRIYTDFQKTVPAVVQSSIERELASLVSPIGLNLDWKSLSEPRDGQASAALVVITFKGRCDLAAMEPRRNNPGALAWTHISDGLILPFVDVDCDGIREFLQAKLLCIEAQLRERLFGRAIARLVAHELYHVFAETTHHGKEGVAEPACTVNELLSEEFRFAEPQFRTLRSSKLRSILSLAKPSLAKTVANRGHAEYLNNGCGACHGAAGEGTRLAPPLGVRKKNLDPKLLASHFEKKSEEMYRRSLNLKLSWYFPTAQEVRDIVSVLTSGLE